MSILVGFPTKNPCFWVRSAQKLVGCKSQVADTAARYAIGRLIACEPDDIKKVLSADVSPENDFVTITIDALDGIAGGAVECFGVTVPSSQVLLI